jgi:hypothetical protein
MQPRLRLFFNFIVVENRVVRIRGLARLGDGFDFAGVVVGRVVIHAIGLPHSHPKLLSMNPSVR